MNKTKLAYFEKEDILHLAITDEPESGSIELSPNMTAECQHIYSRFRFRICTGKNASNY